ncbi:MAG: hypothetical protein UH851_02045, partial [Clostridia bacterium]|nr:hypothetical protein [Clostridia bacterium]
ETETDPETPYVPVELDYTTVVDGFKDGDWSFVYDVNDYDQIVDGVPGTVLQKVTVANGAIYNTNRAMFGAKYATQLDLSTGFRFTVTTDVINTDASDSENSSRYWGDPTAFIIGRVVVMFKNAFHEHYNGAAPVRIAVYEDVEVGTTFDSIGNLSQNIFTICDNAMLSGEYYTDAWAANGSISEDVCHYMNTTVVISYDGNYLSVAIEGGDETILFETWDGSEASTLMIDSEMFSDADIYCVKGWGGYKENANGHAYLKDLLIEKGTPKVA